MTKKDFTNTSKLLLSIVAITDLSKYIIGTPRNIARQWDPNQPKKTSKLLRHLVHRGLVRLVDKNNEIFIQLTKKGQIETLFHKALIPQPQIWDKKWRIIIFDIPEASRNHRAKIRLLLKKLNFLQLQGSVYVSPFPINQNAVDYLHAIKLNKFIRILLVEKIDNDSDLKKKFKL